MTSLYSLRYSRLDEIVVADNDWLAPSEQAELALLRDASRRRQWLAGRWVAKQLVQDATGETDLTKIEILTRNDRRQGVQPRILVRSQDLPWSLSISHSSRGVLVALADSKKFLVGADLVNEVPHTPGFRQLWFSAEERTFIAGDARRTAIVWAIKEATYKALNIGESWNPRAIEVYPVGLDQFACQYRGQRVEPHSLTIDQIDGQLAVIACLPRADEIRAIDATHQTSHPVFVSRRSAKFVHAAARINSAIAC